MTRSELTDNIIRAHKDLVVQDIELAVKNILEQLSDTLAQGERIEIRGFGSFALHHRPARAGRNPKTGTVVAVEERYTPRFRAGRLLRDRINGQITD